MDVNVMQNSLFSAQNAKLAYSAYSSTNQKANASADIGNAYELQISDAAKQAQNAQQAAKNAKVAPTVEEETAEVQTKGVSASTLEQMKESVKLSEETMLNVMIQAMTDSNQTLQSWLDSGAGFLNFGGKKIEAARFSMPEVATNPADAAKAVADGGAWSVDAVAGRLFDLASAIAGDDPEKLQEMRAAVEEGFKQAGAAWQGMTGSSSMPDITSRTYNELMHRFDARMQELTGGIA
ncbi:MAG: hypothetical protein IJQ16_10060 [Selenomonadaceae bacterium]|nr:hypothetical protein [Selenomonadaceae bacterium]